MWLSADGGTPLKTPRNIWLVFREQAGANPSPPHAEPQSQQQYHHRVATAAKRTATDFPRGHGGKAGQLQIGRVHDTSMR